MVSQGSDGGKQFYPDYVVEILVVAFVVVEMTLILAMVFPQGIGRQIDFSAQYQPKPEWYFLWLYQFVRYFPGRSAFIGTVLIPVGAGFLLLLVPFFGRGKYGRLKVIIAAMILLSTFLIFTLIPVLSQ